MTKSCLAGLSSLAVSGVLFLIWITPYGIGLSPDSASYLCAARGLLSGKGLIDIAPWTGQAGPFSRFGPLFSILLAGIGLFRIDPLAGARILNLFLFGANIFLAGWITFHFTRSIRPSLLSSFLFLTSFVTLEIHAYAWSEPTFIFFMLLGFYFLARFLEEDPRPRILIVSSIFLSLAVLAKYSAVSVIAAGTLSVFLLSPRPFRFRVGEALIFGFLTSLPMIVWLIRNRILVGEVTGGLGMTLRFTPYLWPNLRELLAFPSVWLLPRAVPRVIRGIFLMLVVLGVGAACLRLFKEKGKGWKLTAVLIAGIFSHIGIYLSAGVFLGGQAIDDRALSPVFAVLTVLIPLTGHSLGKAGGTFQPLLRPGLILFSLFLAFSYGFRGAHWMLRAHQDGLGYASRSWKNSLLIQKVKALPAGIPIYTNGIDALYLLSGRFSTAIPAAQNALKADIPDPEERRRPDYASEMEKMAKAIREGNGFVVYLDKIYWRWYYPSKAELAEAAGLEAVQDFSDGTLYGPKIK